MEEGGNASPNITIVSGRWRQTEPDRTLSFEKGQEIGDELLLRKI
jgi:hypothetical protein